MNMTATEDNEYDSDSSGFGGVGGCCHHFYDNGYDCKRTQTTQGVYLLN
jgi:hypothetical protein